MKPSQSQQGALVLAVSEGYVNPGSATHQRRLNTNGGQLSRTCKACALHGWMRPASVGRFIITNAGREHVPSSPAPRFDGETWAKF